VENFLGKFSPAQSSIYWSQMWMKAEISLVDAQWPLCIKKLQGRGIPTLAFTAAPGGKVGHISDLAEWRFRELQGFGFDFTKTLPHIEFLEFPKKDSKPHPPLFKSGILFSSMHSKGDILRQFLEAIQWYPSHVVLIDDYLKNLHAVEGVLQEMGIPFTGYHYQAVEKLSSTVDHEIAELQFRYLVEHEEWLSDEEAREAKWN
jgi:hypothetical protein